jgi:anti-anti-sigma regulatory factor
VKPQGDARTAVAINLDIGGRRAASARVELVDEPGEPRVARVALRGWIDRAAERRLERALAALAPRQVSRVVLDCSDVSRLDGPQAARLLDAVARFETVPTPIEVCGLPTPLRERLGARVRRSAEPEPEPSPPGEPTT